jgi:hypothetical protein
MRKILGLENLHYIAAGIILLALTAGCDFLFGPEELPEGNITISFNRGGNGARAVSQRTISQGFIDTFRYEVEFRGPGGARINRNAAPGTESIRVSLALGTWDISAAAYIPDGHLAGTGSVTVKVTSRGGTIIIPMTLGMMYGLGETGPGGGMVFYDKGAYSNSWRYLEVSFTDIDPDTNNDSIGDGVNWCATSKLGLFAGTPLTGISVGDGLTNTLLIVSIVGDNDGELYAARLCADYRGGGLDDWFLPSGDELGELNHAYFADTAMFSDLALITGTGPGNCYWSSSDDGASYAKYYGFGSLNYSGVVWGSQSAHVRAVRRF